MSNYVDVYIAHDDGSFRNHISQEERLEFPAENYWGYNKTLCDLLIYDLVDHMEVMKDNVHFEHERDDVIICDACMNVFIKLHNARHFALIGFVRM